jgi:hypothetical protein
MNYPEKNFPEKLTVAKKEWTSPTLTVINIETHTLSTGAPTGIDGFNTYS